MALEGFQLPEPVHVGQFEPLPPDLDQFVLLQLRKGVCDSLPIDAKRIGQAAEGEIDDTAKREREALEKRRNTDELRDGDGEDTSDSGSGEDAATIARIEAQMKANKRRN